MSKEELKLLSVKSMINQDIEQISEKFLGELERTIERPVHLIGPEELGEEEFCIVYIASGGSEIQFRELMEAIGTRKVYLLTSGQSNSLAASMEILSYVRNHGNYGEIIHGDMTETGKTLEAVLKAEHAKKRLSGMYLGQVGEPSDWLIASRTDREAVKNRLGIEICDISIEELMEEYEKREYASDQWTELLKSCEFDREELEKALHIYGAFDRLIKKYGLGGISVRCFDLLESVKTTGCLGLAILNARGIYGGCEGDMPSLISMAILGEISGKPVFMCNPSRIDTKTKEMVFAHCTLPLNMPYRMKLMTHFESDIGVAVAGAIPEGPATIFKASNDLGRYFAASGEILENLQDANLCRSQIRIKLPECQYFLEAPIQNHHLICTGNEVEALERFFESIQPTPPASSSSV